ncbi:DUF4148 domain-containing protein [Caballeronia sp. HLA56]
MLKLHTLLAVAALLVPPLSHAQTSESATRAQVRENLVQLENAGYKPYANNWLYPRNLQQAEATVAREQSANAAFGSATDSAVQSGR